MNNEKSSQLSQSSLDKFFSFVKTPEKKSPRKFESPIKKQPRGAKSDLFVVDNGLPASQYMYTHGTRSSRVATTSKTVVIGNDDDVEKSDYVDGQYHCKSNRKSVFKTKQSLPRNLVEDRDSDDQENVIGCYTSKLSTVQRYAARKANKKLAEKECAQNECPSLTKQRKITYVDMDEGLARTFRPSSDGFTGQFHELNTVTDADVTLVKEKLVGSIQSPTGVICNPSDKQLSTPLREYHNIADRATQALRHTDKRVMQPFKAPRRLPSQDNIVSSEVVGESTIVASQYSTHRPKESKNATPKESPSKDRCKFEGASTVMPAKTVHPDLQKFDPKIVEIIENEIYTSPIDTVWEDIAGLDNVKKALQEIVIWPFQRPELFYGVRTPAKGVLLFGPPGTGKTMMARCIAAQCQAAFFNISAASLTSKWVGEGEKIARALFAVARTRLPAVIFIDEIDSLLSARSDSEHESSRRIKTEFLTGLDGLDVSSDERLLILGATNRPEELDEAVRRRFTKRLYIPLPQQAGRKQIITALLRPHSHSLTDQDIDMAATLTDGYSGADVRCVTAEAAYGPLRDLNPEQFSTATHDQIRPIQLLDFENAIKTVKPSVSKPDLARLVNWNEMYGVTTSKT